MSIAVALISDSWVIRNVLLNEVHHHDSAIGSCPYYRPFWQREHDMLLSISVTQYCCPGATKGEGLLAWKLYWFIFCLFFFLFSFYFLFFSSEMYTVLNFILNHQALSCNRLLYKVIPASWQITLKLECKNTA